VVDFEIMGSDVLVRKHGLLFFSLWNCDSDTINLIERRSEVLYPLRPIHRRADTAILLGISDRIREDQLQV